MFSFRTNKQLCWRKTALKNKLAGVKISGQDFGYKNALMHSGYVFDIPLNIKRIFNILWSDRS